MVEKNLVVNNKELVYQGIFRVDELFSAINRALEEKGYTKCEKKSEELVTSAGRMLFLELRPYKVISEYITLMIKIKITLDNITDVKEEINGHKVMFQKGDIKIAFDSWSLTDYQSKLELTPGIYFMKSIINKFLYTLPLESGSIRTLGSDTAYIYAQTLKFLNSYKSKPKKASEEKVRKEIEEEIKKQSE